MEESVSRSSIRDDLAESEIHELRRILTVVKAQLQLRGRWIATPEEPTSADWLELRDYVVAETDALQLALSKQLKRYRELLEHQEIAKQLPLWPELQ